MFERGKLWAFEILYFLAFQNGWAFTSHFSLIQPNSSCFQMLKMFLLRMISDHLVGEVGSWTPKTVPTSAQSSNLCTFTWRETYKRILSRHLTLLRPLLNAQTMHKQLSGDKSRQWGVIFPIEIEKLSPSSWETSVKTNLFSLVRSLDNQLTYLFAQHYSPCLAFPSLLV